jgi:16S rRNA C967 or C1407 C5-methylase (RsmB/RsmF family)
MIADLLEKKGSITGVDFSRQRLGAAKQLVHKYGLVFPPVTSSGSPTDSEDTWRCRLFHADGQTFSIGPLTDYRDPKEEEKDQNKEEEENNGTEELEVEVFVDTKEILQRSTRHARKRKRMNKSARARAKKTQKKWFFHEKLYDKVLVDAECTHDGSIKHLQKLETLKDWTDYVTNHLNKKEIHRILCLQQALIQNGFRLLKEKGILIYSTCSLSTLQNERVVSNFLASNPDAILQKIDPPANIPCISSPQVNGTIRFTPSKQTSGLFIAKFIKKK